MAKIQANKTKKKKTIKVELQARSQNQSRLNPIRNLRVIFKAVEGLKNYINDHACEIDNIWGEEILGALQLRSSNCPAPYVQR